MIRSIPSTVAYERLYRPPEHVQSPIATHHLGSGICSHRRTSGPAILVVSVPATIRTSAWRGLARNGNMPHRSMSFLDVAADIISIAQHARPDSRGHRLFIRIRSVTWSAVVGMISRAPQRPVSAFACVSSATSRRCVYAGPTLAYAPGLSEVHSELGTTMGLATSPGAAAMSDAGCWP